MNKERNDFRAGLFIIVSVVLIILVVAGIKGIGRLLEPVQTRMVTFKLGDDVGGLGVGDEVRVGGVKTGVVKSIEIENATGAPTVVVRFTLPRRLVLREGTAVRVQTGITGPSCLNVDDLGTGAGLG